MSRHHSQGLREAGNVSNVVRKTVETCKGNNRINTWRDELRNRTRYDTYQIHLRTDGLEYLR